MSYLTRFGAALVVVIACVVMFSQSVEAKQKRLNDKILKAATKLSKDREAKFSGESAMDDEAFQAGWKTFAEKLDAEFAGHPVKLKKFGTDVRYRKGFAHVMYLALRSQTRGLELKPSAQELVSHHPFLQELVLEGSCYTGGDPFPKKVSDLIQANPGIPHLLAENLDSWDEKYQTKFRRTYPKTN